MSHSGDFVSLHQLHPGALAPFFRVNGKCPGGGVWARMELIPTLGSVYIFKNRFVNSTEKAQYPGNSVFTHATYSKPGIN